MLGRNDQKREEERTTCLTLCTLSCWRGAKVAMAQEQSNAPRDENRERVDNLRV